MARIMRLMGEAARKLEIEFDVGAETRALQVRIVDGLDEAIKAAASQRRPSRRVQSPARSDKRRLPPRKKRADGKESDAKRGSTDSSQTSTARAGSDAGKGAVPGGRLRESRRSWGHLPRREREAVLQGIGEKYLERYRAWIEQYYRALQEVDG